MKRSLLIEYKDGTSKEIPLFKAVKINADIGMFHLDRIQEGWRLTYSQDFCEDFSQIEQIQIKREE
jgi:hypothetical protein